MTSAKACCRRLRCTAWISEDGWDQRRRPLMTRLGAEMPRSARHLRSNYVDSGRLSREGGAGCMGALEFS